MVMTSPEIAQLDQLLDLICVRLQPTASEYDDARDKYVAVGRWLSEPGSGLECYLPEIYPQGSFRIGTPIRPITGLEYDVDLVCEVGIDYRTTGPMIVYRLIERRLQQHKVYRDLLERKNRCLRLNYADQFHLDILPACPNPAKGGTAVVVPDREARGWKTSNPKGYAHWFDRCGAVRLTEVKELEPLPVPQPAGMQSPLQRAVQLIKRQRDIAFGISDAAPRSIVLTTLAGHFYSGEGSTVETVGRYLEQLLLLASNRVGPLILTNPTDSEEILSEKWRDDPSSYYAFVEDARRFSRLWAEVRAARGLPEIAESLKLLFGEEPVTMAAKDYVQSLAQARRAGAISTWPRSPLIVGGATRARPIPHNTFYGRNRQA